MGVPKLLRVHCFNYTLLMSTGEFITNNASYTQLIQHSHTISINVGSVSMGFVRVKDRFGYTQVNFFALKTLKK